MFHIVITCATLLSMSMPTKLETYKLFPGVADYCLAHPEAKLSGIVSPFPPYKRSDVMRQGNGEREL
jgi:hypothetical protein